MAPLGREQGLSHPGHSQFPPGLFQLDSMDPPQSMAETLSQDDGENKNVICHNVYMPYVNAIQTEEEGK